MKYTEMKSFGIETYNKLRKLITIRTLLLSLLLTLAVYGCILFIGGAEVNTKLSIQYKGSGEGLNPDGTLFDYNEITSTDVMKRAFKNAKLEYDPKVRKDLVIRPAMPATIIDTIKSKREKGAPYTYFPNEYVITISTGLGHRISYFDAKKLSRVYGDAYREFFEQEYRYPFFNLDTISKNFDYKSYDYPEITKIFGNEYQLIISYIDNMIQDDPEFVTSAGTTFQDIKDSVVLSQSMDLNKIDSIVSTYKLTKDSDKLINKYRFIIRRKVLEENKNTGEYSISKELLNILKKQQNSIVLPSLNGEPTAIKSLDKSYDTMAEKATKAKVAASNVDKDIAYYQSELQKLQYSTVSSDEAKIQKADVLRQSENLNKKMACWMKQIEMASKEYFDYKYSGAVVVVYKGVSNLFNVVRIAALFILFSVGLVSIKLFRTYRTKKRQ